MSKLENVSKSSLVNNHGITYELFKNALRPRYAIVLRDVLLGVVVLLTVVAAIWWLEALKPGFIWMTIPIGSIAMGIVISYLQLFLHEAAHYNLLPDRRLNDLIATWCFGIWAGTSIREYRITHWEHHRNLGTTADPERSYFQAPTLRFLVECVTGIHMLRMMKSRSKSTSLPSPQQSTPLFLVLGIIAHSILLAAAIIAGHGQFAICWFLAMAVVYPFCAAVRQLLEHRDEKADPAINYAEQNHGAVGRLFKHNLLGYIFGAAGFDKHLLHHWEPTLSYTCLPELERFLLDTSECKEIIKHSQTSYPATFIRLFFSK